MLFKLIFGLIKILLVFSVYLIYIFYDELFRERTFVIKFDAKFLNRFNFIKKYIIHKFPSGIDIYYVVSSFFNSLSILNVGFDININLFSRPGVNLRLFLFYIIYNFVACCFICCITWVSSWYRLTAYLRHLDFLPEGYMYLNFKTGPFFMYWLIAAEVLMIILILCFLWWTFEYSVLIPLNLFILLYLAYCFLFSFFCKLFVFLVYYSILNFYLFILKALKYPFKLTFMNFFNNLWPWVRYAVWDNSSIFVKICICFYAFITFNFLVLSVYLFLLNIIVFY